MNTDALKAANEHDPNDCGKFETEDKATVYYYHCMMDGDGEPTYSECECDDSMDCGCDHEVLFTDFEIGADEAKEFGLDAGKIYRIYHSAQGFETGQQVSN